MALYDEDFYATRHEKTVASATRVLNVLAEHLPPITSAVDVGCGVGTWLSVLAARGADVQGLDGPWVETAKLQIPAERFKSADLSQPIDLGRRFDLAITLEVAEHLPESSAKGFVQSLTRLSDFVLFSAAIPGQGGRNHINEQWPQYWADLFAAEGYEVLDFIRPRLWDDRSVRSWYRQNILVFVKRERLGDVRGAPVVAPKGLLALVHPEMYSAKMEILAASRTLRGSAKQFRRAIRRWMRSSLGMPAQR